MSYVGGIQLPEVGTCSQTPFSKVPDSPSPSVTASVWHWGTFQRLIIVRFQGRSRSSVSCYSQA